MKVSSSVWTSEDITGLGMAATVWVTEDSVGRRIGRLVPISPLATTGFASRIGDGNMFVGVGVVGVDTPLMSVDASLRFVDVGSFDINGVGETSGVGLGGVGGTERSVGGVTDVDTAGML